MAIDFPASPTLNDVFTVGNVTIDEQEHQISALAARLTALESA